MTELAIMHNATPPDDTPYAIEIELMRELSWTWTDIQQTPADVLDLLVERISAERHWRYERQKLQAAMK